MFSVDDLVKCAIVAWELDRPSRTAQNCLHGSNNKRFANLHQGLIQKLQWSRDRVHVGGEVRATGSRMKLRIFTKSENNRFFYDKTSFLPLPAV